MDEVAPKELVWIGSSREDLLSFPAAIRKDFGYALHFAQCGEKHPHAKPLTGIEGGVFEVVENFQRDTYRAVYTVKIGKRVYVLHCFQKKSHRGIKTPKPDIDKIKQRLQVAKRVEDERKESVPIYS